VGDLKTGKNIRYLQEMSYKNRPLRFKPLLSINELKGRTEEKSLLLVKNNKTQLTLLGFSIKLVA